MRYEHATPGSLVTTGTTPLRVRGRFMRREFGGTHANAGMVQCATDLRAPSSADVLYDPESLRLLEREAF